MELEKFIEITGLDPDSARDLRAALADDSLQPVIEDFRNHVFTNHPDGADLTAKYGFRRASLAALAASYYTVPYAVKLYAKLGWPREILAESMKDIGIWARHFRRNYGFTGLQQASWCNTHFQAEVLQFGRLQCNTSCEFFMDLVIDGKTVLHKGDPVINIHIPEAGPLLPELCQDSFRRMRRFFAEYRPGYHWKAAVCTSWFLDPQLKQLLPPDSNILKFQALGTPFSYGEGESDAVFRVFGVKGTDAPLITSLQHRMFDFIQKGGKFHHAGIYIPREKFGV